MNLLSIHYRIPGPTDECWSSKLKEQNVIVFHQLLWKVNETGIFYKQAIMESQRLNKIHKTSYFEKAGSQFEVITWTLRCFYLYKATKIINTRFHWETMTQMLKCSQSRQYNACKDCLVILLRQRDKSSNVSPRLISIPKCVTWTECEVFVCHRHGNKQKKFIWTNNWL